MSAIVPARNEERNIAGCVESLLEQAEIAEVLVADDASGDGTAAVVGRIAACDARVRLLSVPPLPAGWLGKNHAVAFAARHARGEWLLLTDADTVHAPEGLARALAECERGGVDLFSLSPAQETVTFWEKAVIPRIFLELETLYRFADINNPDLPAAAANGQYILVRRSVYQALGGHGALRGELLEDVALAAAAKRAGYRLRFGPGAGIVRTRMYHSFGALWEGWTKNLYLLYGRRAGPALRSAAAVWALDVLPAAFLTRRPLPALLWLAARHAWYAARLRRAGEDPRLALYYWPGSVLFSLLVANSVAHHALGLPVAWKGRKCQVRSAECGMRSAE